MYPEQAVIRRDVVVALVQTLLAYRRHYSELAGVGAPGHASGVLPAAGFPDPRLVNGSGLLLTTWRQAVQLAEVRVRQVRGSLLLVAHGYRGRRLDIVETIPHGPLAPQQAAVSRPSRSAPVRGALPYAMLRQHRLQEKVKVSGEESGELSIHFSFNI